MVGTHSAVPPSAASRSAASRAGATPRVPWLAGPHGDVLTGLRSAVFGGAGALVLTGDGGTGKTVVARTLAELMRAQGMAIGRLDHPAQSPDEFLQAVGDAYGWPDLRPDTVRATAERYLADARARGARALLIVEDAHRLGREVLAQIALLVKLARPQGADQRPALTVLLVGQDKLLEMLESLENAAFESLFDSRYRLRPLTEDEAHRYIERLVVGESGSHLFTRPAMQKIAEISRGIPRDIDALCEAALVDASRQRARLVGTKLIPSSVAAASATRHVAPTPRNPVSARRRPPRWSKPYRNRALVGVGLLLLLALPAAYAVRHVRPQPAAARMRPSIAPPAPSPNVVVPLETARVEPPTPAAPPVQESVAPMPEASPTVPAPPPAPPPAIAVTTPPEAPPALRERPTVRAESTAPAASRPMLRSEPPAPAVARPMVPRERPLAPERPARPAAQRTEPDPSAIMDWLFRDTPRASD